MNKCFLIGRLGADPRVETVTVDGGNGTSKVANLNLAVDFRFKKDADGKPLAQWFDVSAWGKTAEFCEKYMRKGCSIAVVGEIDSPNCWTDNTNNARARCRVRADEVKMVIWPKVEENPAQSDSGKDEEIPF